MKDITTEEAVNELKERIQTLKRHIKNYEESKCETNIYNQLKKESKAIEKVLNELEKKNKIINAMATTISGISEIRAIMGISNVIASQDEIIKKYERNVVDE